MGENHKELLIKITEMISAVNYWHNKATCLKEFYVKGKLLLHCLYITCRQVDFLKFLWCDVVIKWSIAFLTLSSWYAFFFKFVSVFSDNSLFINMQCPNSMFEFMITTSSKLRNTCISLLLSSRLAVFLIKELTWNHVTCVGKGFDLQDVC